MVTLVVISCAHIGTCSVDREADDLFGVKSIVLELPHVTIVVGARNGVLSALVPKEGVIAVKCIACILHQLQIIHRAGDDIFIFIESLPLRQLAHEDTPDVVVAVVLRNVRATAQVDAVDVVIAVGEGVQAIVVIQAVHAVQVIVVGPDDLQRIAAKVQVGYTVLAGFAHAGRHLSRHLEAVVVEGVPSG